MPRHLGSSVTAPPDLGRLGRWIGVSVAVHVALVLVTSAGFIARGFKPADAPKPAAAAAPAAAPAADAKPADAKPVEATTAAKPAASGKLPSAKPKDAEAEYFKDDKQLSPDELKKGPSLDLE